MNILDFFTDPVLRAPTLGSMLMCFAAGLVGVLVFIKKRSLLGEALSHAIYPGVTAAIVCAGIFAWESSLTYLVLAGAFLSAIAGYWVVLYLEKKLKVHSDAALAAVLAVFFGIGVTVASFAQHTYASLYRQIQAYLYGQAATMTDTHIMVYGIFAAFLAVFIVVFYKEILTLSFDAQFARTNGMMNRFLDTCLFLMVVLALVIGVRCVGVILMSAMLIAPAAAARQFTNHLSYMFVLAGLFGILSGFSGVYASFMLSTQMGGHYAFPTGPMIVLVGGSIALLALLFAPNRGIMSRYARAAKFRRACIQENLLKALWRQKLEGRCALTFSEMVVLLGRSPFSLRYFIYKLIRQKALEKQGSYYHLTILGTKRGARIVRLHRLWEVYLVHSLGLKVERVHKSAEEMEHILTPELEQKLTLLLDNPRHDPHDQPIPQQEEEGYVF